MEVEVPDHSNDSFEVVREVNLCHMVKIWRWEPIWLHCLGFSVVLAILVCVATLTRGRIESLRLLCCNSERKRPLVCTSPTLLRFIVHRVGWVCWKHCSGSGPLWCSHKSRFELTTSVHLGKVHFDCSEAKRVRHDDRAGSDWWMAPKRWRPRVCTSLGMEAVEREPPTSKSMSRWWIKRRVFALPITLLKRFLSLYCSGRRMKNSRGSPETQEENCLCLSYWLLTLFPYNWVRRRCYCLQFATSKAPA